MEITLNQSEIEQAIRNYLDTQFRINEGQDISIEMKAGRGENGFTASIDIVPAGTRQAAQGTEAPKSLGIKEQTARTPKTTVIEKTSPQAEPTPDTANEAGSADQETAAETTTTETAQDAAGEAPAAEGDNAASEGSNEQAVSEAPRASLFGALKKPQN